MTMHDCPTSEAALRALAAGGSAPEAARGSPRAHRQWLPVNGHGRLAAYLCGHGAEWLGEKPQPAVPAEVTGPGTRGPAPGAVRPGRPARSPRPQSPSATVIACR